MTSGKFATTVGYERRFNPALQFSSRQAFVEYMNQDQPVRPANIVNIVAINQGKRPLTMDEPHTAALSPSEVSDLIGEGYLVVDTRSEAAFGSGHIPGAYNIQLSSPEFEQRAGWVTPLDAPMIVVLDNDADAQRVMHALAFLGLDQRVKGFLMGGINNWLNKGLPLRTLPQVSVQQLADHLQNDLDMRVLDVRETSEWDAGHIEGAHYMNYKFLREKIDSLALKPDDHVSVLCARGLRSSTACSILLMNGFKHVHNVTGGMSAWAAAGLSMLDAHGSTVSKPEAPKPEWFEL